MVRLGVIGLGLRVRNSHYGSNGSGIGNRRWSSINSIYIVMIVWSPTIASVMSIGVAKVMRPGAIPAISMPTGVVIGPVWTCLDAQGA